MRNLSGTALAVLIIGVILLLLAPLIFTRPGCISFKETGTIGDTIGGITAPITGLIGSVLVFLALRAQIVANEIIQAQIRDQKLDEKRKKEMNYLSDLYKYFLKNIEDFDFDKKSGNAGVLSLFAFLASWERKNAHKNINHFQKVAEYYGILTFGKFLLERIHKANVDEEDKILFRELIKHHFDSMVLPSFSFAGHKEPCTVCQEDHNGIPFEFRKIIAEIQRLY